MKPESQKTVRNGADLDLARRIAALSPQRIRVISEAIKNKKQILALQQQELSNSLLSLERIRATGTKQPIFLVHPAGGGVECYHELAKHLDEAQSVYAFQGHIFGSHRASPYSSVQEIASRCIQSVQLVQPGPPYMLGGWSFGGLVAFDMAVQLEQSGRGVSLLALLDAPSRVRVQPRPTSSRVAADIVALGEALAAKQGKDFNLDRRQLEDLNSEQQIAQFLQALRTERLVPAEMDAEAVHALVETFSNHHKAMENYVPQIYHGRVVVLRASQPSPTIRDLIPDVYDNPSFGWQAFCTQTVEVRFAPGDHLGMMMQPNIQTVGAVLQACIDEMAERNRFSVRETSPDNPIPSA